MVRGHKKTLEKELDASSQKRRAEMPGFLDEMHDYCRTIATVAALLEASRSEFLHPQVVPDAGTLIADTVREVEALLKILEENEQ